jgi:hypothetical protein
MGLPAQVVQQGLTSALSDERVIPFKKSIGSPLDLIQRGLAIRPEQRSKRAAACHDEQT